MAYGNFMASVPAQISRSSDCSLRQPYHEQWACLTPKLLNTSAFPDQLDFTLEDPWLPTLEAMYSVPLAEKAARERKLNVAFMGAFPEHGAGPEGRFFNTKTGRGPLSCNLTAPWTGFFSPGEDPLAGFNDPHEKNASSDTQKKVGCDFRNGYLQLSCLQCVLGWSWMLKADTLHWPIYAEPDSEEARAAFSALLRYDVVIYLEFERRLLPKLPEVPGQMRLWASTEPYSYGDITDFRHTHFNVFTAERLAESAFCPVALDPFLTGPHPDMPVVMPFWMHFPRGDLQSTHGFRTVNLAAQSPEALLRRRRVILVRGAGITTDPEFMRYFSASGWEVLNWQNKTYVDYISSLPRVRYMIWMHNKGVNAGRSAGRPLADAAMFGGIPVFGRRDRFFQRLLMPPFFSVASPREIMMKINELERNPAAYARLCASIARRGRFVDANYGLTPGQLVSAISGLSSSMGSLGREFCQVNTERRLAALAFPRFAPLVPLPHPHDYLRSWMLDGHAALRGTNLADLAAYGSNCMKGSRHPEMELRTQAVYFAQQLHSTDVGLHRALATCLTLLSVRTQWDQPLTEYILELALAHVHYGMDGGSSELTFANPVSSELTFALSVGLLPGAPKIFALILQAHYHHIEKFQRDWLGYLHGTCAR